MIYIGLLVHPGSNRINLLKELFVNELKNLGNRVVFSFVDAAHVYSPDIIPHNEIDFISGKYKGDQWHYQRSLDIGSRFIALCRDFLASSAVWLYRGTDDSLIVVPRLLDFFDDLNRKYRPKTDPVILGHAVSLAGLCFIQGGSGYLFSRAAVEKIFPILNQWVMNYDPRFPEDIEFNKLITYVGLTIEDTMSSAFVGHGIRPDVGAPIPDCNDVVYSEKSLNSLICPQLFFPLKDIIFYHSNQESIYRSIDKFKYVKDPPDDIWVYSYSSQSRMCRNTNISLIKK